jgi:broad specificity phosphatase PhoE
VKETPYPKHKIVLVRHAETEWSTAGRHTSFTDLPLTEEGRRKAKEIAARMKARRFELVLASPLQRSIETCRIAGFSDLAEIRDGLTEWDYGDYEGLTTAQIREHHRGGFFGSMVPWEGKSHSKCDGESTKSSMSCAIPGVT